MSATKRELAARPVVGQLGRVSLWAAVGVLAAVLMALAPRSLAAGLAFVVLASILVVVEPVAACALLVPAVAFGPGFTRSLGPLRVGATDAIIGAIVLGWTVRTIWPALAKSGRLPALSPRGWPSNLRANWRADRSILALGAALLAYLAVIVLSGVVAADRSLAAKEAIKWTEVLIVLLFAGTVLQTAPQREVVAWTVVATGVVQALIGYGQWILATGSIGPDGSSLRVYGTFGQPNPYAAYLNLALPFALAFAALHRRMEARWVAAGATMLLLVAQGLAASRGGLLALAAATLVMVVVVVRIERVALPLAAVIALVVGAAWALGVLPQRLRDAALHALRLDGVSLTGPLNDANFSSVERLAHWVAGLRMFAAHPVLGVGAGNYSVAYARFAVPGWPDPLGHAHNYFINAAAETGVLGGLVFCALVVSLFLVAWRAVTLCRADVRQHVVAGQFTVRRAISGFRWRALVALWHAAVPDYALSLAVLGVVVAVTVQSLVDDVFVHAMELQIALCLGLAARIVIGRTVAVRQADK